jgi:hypothetical protein
LRVVHRGGVEPGILGSDEPLHGGQRRGHNGKLIRGAKSQIRICVLGAYFLRHAALSLRPVPLAYNARPHRRPDGPRGGRPHAFIVCCHTVSRTPLPG